MQFDLSKPIIDPIFNEPIRVMQTADRPEGIILTLGVYATLSLSVTTQGDRDALSSVLRGQLAMRIGRGDSGLTELSPEDVVLIRDRAKLGGNAVAAAQLHDALGGVS